MNIQTSCKSPRQRQWQTVALILIMLLACQTLMPSPEPTPTARTTSTTVPTVPATAAAPVQVTLSYYPNPAISGDVLTFDARIELAPGVSRPATASLALPSEKIQVEVGQWALGSSLGARWIWAWDTAAYSGTVPVTMTLTWPPDAGVADTLEVVVPVTLADPETRSAYERQARWMLREAPGLRLHFISGSAAARDQDMLLEVAQNAYQAISTALGVADNPPVDIYLLDRVYGQGGYATADWIAITYADRNYAPAQLDLVLQHELTHRLDAALGCQEALTLVREGLAVYLSGGHYRREPGTFLLSSLRAAGLYIPLETLVQDFYTHQHEIGYLEAASLVAFVDAVHGRDGLRTFCAATLSGEDRDERARLLAGAQALGYSAVADLERAWWAWADREPPQERLAQALHVETALLDTLRAYQQAYDPVAYYLTGVLYDVQLAESRQLTTDFVRAPQSAEAVTLELLLKQGLQAFQVGQLERAAALTGEVQQVLAQGFPSSGLAAELRTVVQACQEAGYTPYAVSRSGPGHYVVQVTQWDVYPRRVLLLAENDTAGWRVTFLAGLDQSGPD